MAVIFILIHCTFFKFQYFQNTCQFTRLYQCIPGTVKKNRGLRKEHYIYKLEDVLSQKSAGNMEVLLTNDIEGIIRLSIAVWHGLASQPFGQFRSKCSIRSYMRRVIFSKSLLDSDMPFMKNPLN